jgi:hypothetical protein
MCTQKRWNSEVANIFGAAARYRRAKVGSSHDDAGPDNSTLHADKFTLFAAPQQSFTPLAATASRRRGSDLGITIKYLRKKTGGATGIGLGTTIKYPRRTTGAAAGSGLGTTLN